VAGAVTVLEGIDVADDGVGARLSSALAGKTIDVVVHNAGSATGGGRNDVEKQSIFDQQKLATISMDRMRQAFEVNTLGPLRVQKALMPFMKRGGGGKIIVISTGIGSIADNGSGGKYAYRTSKAAANMVMRSMAMDLRGDKIAVQSIAPGFVATEFGAGLEMMTKWGGAPVDRACRTIIGVIDSMTMETTGGFTMVPTDGSAPKPFPW
jgi:tubulin alpha